MYHSYFGKLGQLRFPKPEDYYRFLGFLAHADINENSIPRRARRFNVLQN